MCKHSVLAKWEFMFRSMQNNWFIWMRVVTVTVAAMAILVSALAISSAVDHHVLTNQPSVASAVDVSVADDGAANPEADANCHIGYGCILAIMPGEVPALTGFERAPERPRVTGYQPSAAENLPFHPPRFFSRV